MCAMGVAPGQVVLLFRQGGSTEPTQGGGGSFPRMTGGASCTSASRHRPANSPRRSASRRPRDLDRERPDWPHGGRSIYFRDPDGHALEIATQAYGRTIKHGTWQPGPGVNVGK